MTLSAAGPLDGRASPGEATLIRPWSKALEPGLKAAVVVPTFDGRDMLRDCLDALRGQTFKDFEVRVVDNGSSDGTREMLARRFPEVKLIALGRNLGFARAVNARVNGAANGEGNRRYLAAETPPCLTFEPTAAKL